MSNSQQQQSPLISPLVTRQNDDDDDDVAAAMIPTVALVIALCIVMPLWAATVLPLTIAYRMAKVGYEMIVGNKNSTSWSYTDTGYKVKPEQIKPFSKRTYDVVILGATGFTGGLAVRHLVLTYGVDNASSVKWAIAGRSQAKLDAFKAKLAKELKIESVKNIPTILVDTTIPSTLPRLVQDTRVVATTAGPYSLYGSPVVEFCAKFGTHYVDITGEVNWVKHMAILYQDTARQTGAKIVPFCGHDSVPWDILSMRMLDILSTECGDDLEKVTFWDDVRGGFAGGTLATNIAGFEGKIPKTPPQTPDNGVDFFQRNTEGKASLFSVVKELPKVPEKCVSPWDQNTPSTRKRQQRWTIPFFMADVNAQVVAWSQSLREKGAKELIYTEKWVLPDFKSALTIYTGLVMVGVSLMNPFTLRLAKHIFTQPGSGPALEDMEKKHYLLISGEGIGEKGNRVQATLYFPKDPGCMETSRMLIESALCLALQDGDALPSKNLGGFWTPSTALGDTLVQRILDTGSTMEVARVI